MTAHTNMRTHHALVQSPVTSLDEYTDLGGFDGLKQALQAGSDATISLIEAAGIRGRGGAGFPTYRKWASLKDSLGSDDLGYVVVNAAEGEPGTFKDRSLIRANPFLVLEGALIAAVTLGMRQIVVGTKKKYGAEIDIIKAAIAELEQNGWLDEVSFRVVEGPDRYLFGEETAMLEVIEGEEPLPRHMPPYQYGLFTTSPQLGWSAGTDERAATRIERSNPALVNNVETLAHVALACRNGADWYRSMGTELSPGPTIVTLTGDVATPAVAEISLGTSLADLIAEIGGGTGTGLPIKAVLSGVSNPVLIAAKLDTPVTYEDLNQAGGGLGSGGFIVFDDSHNMVDVAYQVIRFLHVESCGQCNPCKTGTSDIAVALEDLVQGVGDTADVDRIARALETVTDASRCYLPSQARVLIASLLQLFPEDLAERLEGIPGNLDLRLPQLVDLIGNVATYDQSSAHKRADWTMSESLVWFSNQ